MTTRTPAPTTQELRKMALYFYALKDVVRLEMVCVLAGREQTVNELAEALNRSQPLVSWHLRRLQAAGIVNLRRSGREVYCSLDRAVLTERQQAFLDLLGAA